MQEILSYLVVFGLGAAPISEVRGAIMAGFGMGLNPWATLVIGILGNILVMPVVFWVLRKTHLREWIFRVFGKMAHKHAHNNKMFYVYEEIALMLFVAVPLPVTGGYTGALISELLGWKWKKSFIAISLGIIIAGIIVFLAAEGVIKLVGLI